MSGRYAAEIAFHTLVTFAGLAAISMWVARDRAIVVTDLPQDYTSARAWLEGDSAYRPLNELFTRYGFPPHHPEVMVKTNPHPPAAVLLTVPYALLDYESALAWVRWTQLFLLALTWAIGYGMFRPPLNGFLWAVIGCAFGLWAPVWQGLAWAQPVGLLAFATVSIWLLARTEKLFAFGVVLGVATLIRPFVAIHIVLACGWSSRQQVKAIVGLLVGGCVPFALFGIWPLEWYRLASDAGGYVSECGSLPNVLGLGAGGGQVLYAMGAGVLAWLRWRGIGVDETAALAAVTAMLVYPLAWFQYDTSLIPVVAWVGAGVASRGNRVALWGLVLYLMMRTAPDMIPTPGGTGLIEALARNKSELQVLARALLLVAVIASIRSVRISVSERS